MSQAINELESYQDVINFGVETGNFEENVVLNSLKDIHDVFVTSEFFENLSKVEKSEYVYSLRIIEKLVEVASKEIESIIEAKQLKRVS